MTFCPAGALLSSLSAPVLGANGRDAVTTEALTPNRAVARMMRPRILNHAAHGASGDLTYPFHLRWGATPRHTKRVGLWLRPDLDGAARRLAGSRGGSAFSDHFSIIAQHLGGLGERVPRPRTVRAHKARSSLPEGRLADDVGGHAFGHAPALRQGPQRHAGQERP